METSYSCGIGLASKWRFPSRRLPIHNVDIAESVKLLPRLITNQRFLTRPVQKLRSDYFPFQNGKDESRSVLSTDVATGRGLRASEVATAAAPSRRIIGLARGRQFELELRAIFVRRELAQRIQLGGAVTRLTHFLSRYLI